MEALVVFVLAVNLSQATWWEHPREAVPPLQLFQKFYNPPAPFIVPHDPLQWLQFHCYVAQPSTTGCQPHSLTRRCAGIREAWVV